MSGDPEIRAELQPSFLRSRLLEQLDDFGVAFLLRFTPNRPDPFFQLFSLSGEAHYS